jgi:lipopolysaccharide/colanic/teichoic acid biosynthesis glycosyltransferase
MKNCWMYFCRRSVHDYELPVVPRLHLLRLRDGLSDDIGAIPIMRINNPSLRGPCWAAKCGFYIAASALALLIFEPLWALCAVAVRIEEGPGVLFRHEHVGIRDYATRKLYGYRGLGGDRQQCSLPLTRFLCGRSIVA